jgi:hypothetical protein
MSRRTVTGPAERRATREGEQHERLQQNFHFILSCIAVAGMNSRNSSEV